MTKKLTLSVRSHKRANQSDKSSNPPVHLRDLDLEVSKTLLSPYYADDSSSKMMNGQTSNSFLDSTMDQTQCNFDNSNLDDTLHQVDHCMAGKP
jgi:hypothetical protein